MSDGIRDAYGTFYMNPPDPKDADCLEFDLSDFDDPTEIGERKTLRVDDWYKEWDKRYACDCGGKVANTTHSFWCSTRKA